jgi:Acetyltransferase (GNAT) domain
MRSLASACTGGARISYGPRRVPEASVIWPFVRCEEKDLLAVSCPARLDSAVLRHLPSAAGAWKGRNVYFTFPEFERQGYPTAMASTLLEIADSASELSRIGAETAPEKNASTRILEKLGFTFVGETVDAEIGKAWRWERPATI